MEMLRLRHPELGAGWKIVNNKCDIVKKSHYISIEELKEKMEENIEETVSKSLLDEEYEGLEDQKENRFANRKTMKGEVRDAHGILQQREERKKKLIENDWEYQREERKRKLIQAAPRRGGLKVHGQKSCGMCCANWKRGKLR